MTIQALRLDGNAIAGVLYEVFGTELTTLWRPCHSCRTPNMVGAYHVYRGAGAALRCPVYIDVALTIASLPDRHVVRLYGIWVLEIPRS
ncbi:MAG: hypothetical protein QOJ13_2359 [Gaiellales bacterium]|jgi:hypothetical protein|nr:hypothetical protein [Gaiellales bacterium]